MKGMKRILLVSVLLLSVICYDFEDVVNIALDKAEKVEQPGDGGLIASNWVGSGYHAFPHSRPNQLDEIVNTKIKAFGITH